MRVRVRPNPTSKASSTAGAGAGSSNSKAGGGRGEWVPCWGTREMVFLEMYLFYIMYVFFYEWIKGFRPSVFTRAFQQQHV